MMRGSPLVLFFFLLVWCFDGASFGWGLVLSASLAVPLGSEVESRMVDASRPSRRAAKVASMRRSSGRSLLRLHRSEQYFTSEEVAFADCDFREPVMVHGKWMNGSNQMSMIDNRG